MIQKILTVCAAIALAAPAFAEGDAEKGEKEFKKCKSCHAIASEDETIVKGGRTGPNLYGIPGRAAGTVEGFRYSGLVVTAGEGGLVWDEASFIGFVQDPSAYLKDLTGESGRSKMTFKVRKEEAAMNLWAYLVSVSPAPEN